MINHLFKNKLFQRSNLQTSMNDSLDSRKMRIIPRSMFKNKLFFKPSNLFTKCSTSNLFNNKLFFHQISNSQCMHNTFYGVNEWTSTIISQAYLIIGDNAMMGNWIATVILYTRSRSDLFGSCMSNFSRRQHCKPLSDHSFTFLVSHIRYWFF